MLDIALALMCAHAAATAPATAAPQIFAPGVISGPAHDSAPAFTRDGALVYFSRSSAAQSTILVSKRRGDRWSEPEIARFSGEWNDMEPTMAPDGTYLVFVSNRPLSPGGTPIEGHYNGTAQKGGNLWRIDRTDSGWGEPQHLPDVVNTSTSTFAPSIAADGSLWFMTPDAKSGKFRLHRAQWHDGRYETAEPLPFSDGTVSDVDPAVAADESFVVFGSGRLPNRGIDLFIAFRENGRWGEPQWLGDSVNTPISDAEARLGPDGRTLYFSSERTVPVTYPRTREQARIDQARLASWDNGNYNIWSVSLAPWLDAHATAALSR